MGQNSGLRSFIALCVPMSVTAYYWAGTKTRAKTNYKVKVLAGAVQGRFILACYAVSSSEYEPSLQTE